MSVSARAVVATVLYGFAAAANSADVGYAVDANGAYSDNIHRTGSRKINETMVGAGGQLQVVEKSARIDARLGADLDYVEYLDDTYDSEFIGFLKARGKFVVAPDRLHWFVEDNLGQVLREQSAPETPDNRENVNVFTTGPDVILNLTNRTQLELGGRYSNVYYQDSDLGSDRFQETASLKRLLTESSSVSLNASAEQIEPDEETSADFDRNEAFLRYELAGARTSVRADLGQVEIKRADESANDVLVRLDLSRRVSASSILTLAAGQKYSDAARSFQQLQALDPLGQGTQVAQDEPSPFLSRYGSVGWQFEHHNTQLGITASHFDEDYERESDADRKLNLLFLYASRRLGPDTALRFEGGYSHQDFDELDSKFADITAAIVFDWQVGTRAFVSAVYTYITRTDDVGANEFHENRVGLHFGYRSRGFGSLR